MKTVEIFRHIVIAFSHNKSYSRSFSVVILPTCLFRQKANFVYCCTWFENLPLKEVKYALCALEAGRRSSLRLGAHTHSLHKTFLTVPLKHRHAGWAPRAPCELTRRHSSHAIKMIIDFAVIKLIQPWAN